MDAKTKAVRTVHTIHVPCPKNFKPFEYDKNGGRQGNYAVVEHKPGSVVTLDEDEAASLLERGLVKEVDEPEPVAEPEAPKSTGKSSKAS